jgi:outer membrane biogenesis lipoprotein LolB
LKFSAITAVCCFALLGGCATVPSQQGPLASFQALQEQTLATNHLQFTGRFALKASFLAEPVQGRFDWRQPKSGMGPELLEFQNPWGELQAGLGRVRAAESLNHQAGAVLGPAPTADASWQVFDQKGGPVVAASLDRWASHLGLEAKSLAAFFFLLDELAPELKALPNPRPIVKRLHNAEGWMELRLVADPCCN